MLVYAYVLMSTYNLENKERVKGEDFFFRVCVGEGGRGWCVVMKGGGED